VCSSYPDSKLLALTSANAASILHPPPRKRPQSPLRVVHSESLQNLTASLPAAALTILASSSPPQQPPRLPS
jgi:hypothetical protein